MKYFIKHKVILATFLMFFTTESVAKDKILPPEKPIVNEEIKKITKQKKNIYPQLKPKVKKNETQTVIKELNEVDVNAKDQLVIYPEIRPIIVQKKVDDVPKKSEFLSKKDFKLAKQIFDAIDKKNGKLH